MIRSYFRSYEDLIFVSDCFACLACGLWGCLKGLFVCCSASHQMHPSSSKEAREKDSLDFFIFFYFFLAIGIWH